MLINLGEIICTLFNKVSECNCDMRWEDHILQQNMAAPTKENTVLVLTGACVVVIF